MPRRYRLYLILVAATVAADQLTKRWARASLPVDARGNGVHRSVIDGFFDWLLVENTGSAFSLFAGADHTRVFLTIVGVLAIAALTWMVHQAKDGPRALIAAFGLMAGGAIGNLIDRLRFGKVTDFILWRYHEHTWPVFNVADVALTVAAVVFVLASLRGGRAAEADPARRAA
jgi:signal peptidase II